MSIRDSIYASGARLNRAASRLGDSLKQAYTPPLQAAHNMLPEPSADDWPTIPGTPGTPGRPGYAIPAMQKWGGATNLPEYKGDKPVYNPYEGARPEFKEYTGPRTSQEQYAEPTSVRDQRTESQIWDMVRRQGSMRYDPQLQAIQREHPRMQRQAQEAMAAQGLAGSGLAMREAVIPLAQQQQRMMGDVRAERGMFEQTAFDEQTLRERDRTDRMMNEHFNRWMQEQQLGMARVDQTFNQWLGEQGLERQFAADEFNRWLGENQHMLNVTGQQFNQWMGEQNVRGSAEDRQYGQFAGERAYGLQHAQAAAAARGTPGSGGTPARPATMSEYTKMLQDEAMFQAFQDPSLRSKWAEGQMGIKSPSFNEIVDQRRTEMYYQDPTFIEDWLPRGTATTGPSGWVTSVP